MINKEAVDALYFIVHESTAYERGRKVCEKLKGEMGEYVRLSEKGIDVSNYVMGEYLL